ncbi:MAG: polysaccharide deacetylase family protein [Chloroflexi bacterium]|nr:polysaccharide deacetylase family protein [Chloroflexota bacterium]
MRHPSRAPILLALLFAVTACATPAATTPSSPPSAPGGTFAPTASPSPTPSATPSNSPSLSPSASVVPTAPPVTGTSYTVRNGDSLSAIARSYGTSTGQLQAWNSGRYPSLATNPDVIEPGWVLIVSADPNATPIPTPAPTQAPQPTPPPTGAGCTANNRVAAGTAQTFATIPNAGPGVALTFDMGGRMDPAVDIMNFLVANRVCATIFATGVMSNTAQGQQVLGIIRAHPELFEIANHTMYHCDLARGGGGSPSTEPCTGGPFSADRIRKELTDAEGILAAETGQNPQPYWRPPYGSLSQGVIDAAASVGYTKTFMWDIDTIDWKPIGDGGPSAEQIAGKVIGNAVNGSNVLFHLGGYETLDALHLIVPGLRDRGFALTSLSDLLK